jgi:N-acetylated-alpha-linked acidic dipeptidase
MAFEPDIKALGSGADFVPFQDHLGVPTLSAEFVGANGYGYGTYHSNYDSRAYVERVADPGFAQGVTMVQVLGTMAMRMAGAEVLPFRFSHYADALDGATETAEAWAKDAEGRVVTPLDLTAVRASVRRVAEQSAALESEIGAVLERGPLVPEMAQRLNDVLARVEQTLADDEGDPSNAWYRHVIYGWNIYSLYDGQPFPGLAEALRVRDASRVQREVGRIERALARMGEQLEAARRILGPQ